MKEETNLEINSFEAARIAHVTPRAIRKWHRQGKIKGEFIKSLRGGGKTGEKLLINRKSLEIYLQRNCKKSKPKINTCPQSISKNQLSLSENKKNTRVAPGEPGASIVTPLVGGLPAIYEKKDIEIHTINPKLEREGNQKFAILMAYREEAAKNHIPKEIIRKAIAEKYNLGLLLPEIQKEIKKISPSSLKNWDYLERAGGLDALIPQYGGAGQSKITEHEKNILLTLLLHQNRLKTAYAISLAKEYLKRKGIPSPLQPSDYAPLRRSI